MRALTAALAVITAAAVLRVRCAPAFRELAETCRDLNIEIERNAERHRVGAPPPTGVRAA